MEHVGRDDFSIANLPSQPRMRIEKNTSLNLSTSWQRIVFGGPNALNTNTFPVVSSPTKLVDWDSTNNKLIFAATGDRNYDIALYGAFSISNPLTSILTVQPLKIQYRFVIPNGRGSGLDFYFPFPDTDGSNGYADFSPIGNLTSDVRSNRVEKVYANSNVRTNGLALDLKISAAAPLGNVTLNTMTLIIFGS